MILYTYIPEPKTPCWCCGRDMPVSTVRPSPIGPQCGECRESEEEARAEMGATRP